MATCPNCESLTVKPVALDVGLAPLGRKHKLWRVVACPDCACRFYLDRQAHNYAEDEMLTRGRAALYLQQGAGLRQLCQPLALLQLPRGSLYLEIGCGFGFAMDFARHALGWTVQGIDPAQIAALGRTQLDLPIECRMLEGDEPEMAQAFDVVMAAETIEHVLDPSAFLGTLRPMLRPGGVLVLTTPDGAALSPETPPDLLAALLSPGLHCVFQTEASLRGLLAAQGFTHVAVARNGGRLVVHASMCPVKLGGVESVEPMFRTYLEDRAVWFAPASNLGLGLAGRCLLEAANAGDFDRAGRMLRTLRGACLDRFGLDIETLQALPPETASCSLERMAELMPLNLAAILYASAMCALCNGASRSGQHFRLLRAAESAIRLRRATGELGMVDALSEDLAWVATAEALLCEAEASGTDIAALIGRLPVLPGADGRARYEHFVDRLGRARRNASSGLLPLAWARIMRGLRRIAAAMINRMGRQDRRFGAQKRP